MSEPISRIEFQNAMNEIQEGFKSIIGILEVTNNSTPKVKLLSYFCGRLLAMIYKNDDNAMETIESILAKYENTPLIKDDGDPFSPLLKSAFQEMLVEIRDGAEAEMR